MRHASDRAVHRLGPASPAGRALVGAQLRANRPVTLIGVGGSMWPFIQPNTRVQLVPMTRPSVVGDIVLVDGFERLTLHRVVAIDPRGCVCTKGDTNPRVDGWVPPSAVLGHTRSRPWDATVATLSLILGPCGLPWLRQVWRRTRRFR